MSTLEVRLRDVVTRIGTESKALRTLLNGNQSSNAELKTTAKSNLLVALNELYDLIQTTAANNGAKINDASTASTTETYSINKILSSINTSVNNLRNLFDANGDGVVDVAATANSVAYTNVTGKPSTFPPSPHDASLVTSGVFDLARIPIIPSQRQIVSSGDLTALTTAQQNDIGQGTVVTITDGTRYVYSGSGSKTLAASYVVLADITPTFASIENKPTTRAGYGITDAQALDATLTALAGLTTAADQMIYATGADTFAMAPLTSFARTLLDDTTAAAARLTLDAYGSVELGNPDTDYVSVFNTAIV